MRSAPFARRVAALLVPAVALAVATSCVSLPEQKTGNAPPWTPASTASSVKFLERYDNVHLQATEDRDAELAATVETGPLLRASEAAYRIARRVDPQPTNRAAPFTRVDPAIHLPRFTNYPAWLVGVSKQSTDSGREVVDLVTRTTAGTGWRNAVSVALDPNQPVPKLKATGGAAVPVTPKLAAGLRRPPDRAAAAYASLLAGGPTAPQASAFVPHGLTAAAHQAAAQYKARVSELTFAQTFDVVLFRSLLTEDDGALLVFAVEEKTNITVLPGHSLTLRPTDDVAAYTGVTRATKHLRSTAVWQVAAYVPAKGKGDGLVRILGVQRQLATAELA